jgi:glycerol-3-phosphate dehydrogenase (NAD(P)+)
MPAVSVVAGVCPDAVASCQRLLSTALFRPYANCDILGVEICGALKNVIALAAGINDGMGYGANAKAALLTRGLAEISRLGIRLGADRATFWGAAGLGDMVATCGSRLSRNWQVGYQLGSGRDQASALASQAGVAEGVRTTAAAAALAERVGVEAPIITALRGVLFEGREPEDAVRELMARPWRSEAENLA